MPNMPIDDKTKELIDKMANLFVPIIMNSFTTFTRRFFESPADIRNYLPLANGSEVSEAVQSALEEYDMSALIEDCIKGAVKKIKEQDDDTEDDEKENITESTLPTEYQSYFLEEPEVVLNKNQNIDIAEMFETEDYKQFVEEQLKDVKEVETPIMIRRPHTNKK